MQERKALSICFPFPICLCFATLEGLSSKQLTREETWYGLGFVAQALWHLCLILSISSPLEAIQTRLTNNSRRDKLVSLEKGGSGSAVLACASWRLRWTLGPSVASERRLTIVFENGHTNVPHVNLTNIKTKKNQTIS